MFWVQAILYILIVTIISIFIFFGIRKYILLRIRVKKIYPLIVLILFLALPFVFPRIYQSLLVQALQMTLVSISFLTYLEIAKMEKESKNKPVVGRPKKKPGKIK